MEIRAGVNLHLLTDVKKFKTFRISVRLTEPIQPENVAKRALISNLWEESNQIYPTQRALTEKLASLYGANFSSTVSKKGNYHILSMSIDGVKPELIAKDIRKEALDFLEAALFSPLWDEENFSLEKRNLEMYLSSLEDDNAYVANQNLRELYYKEPAQRVASVGDLSTVKKIDLESVKGYYAQMLADNQIDIFYQGQLEETEVTALTRHVSSWAFPSREPLHSLFYAQPLSNLIEKKEEKKANQSLLTMAWQMPVCYGGEEYLTLCLLNALYGGLPSSKLFSVAREQESLAYEISSGFDSFTGLFTMAAGIDAGAYEKAKKLILSLFSEIKQGQITASNLTEAKKMLAGGRFMSKDRLSTAIEQAYIEHLFTRPLLTDEKWLEALNKVKVEDIQKLAAKFELQVVYFLEGKEVVDA